MNNVNVPYQFDSGKKGIRDRPHIIHLQRSVFLISIILIMLILDNVQNGQGKVNQLGGNYINGRPLPMNLRHQIVALYERGVKPCMISRQLRVSHGCVSKILQKYKNTGSIEPGPMTGNTSKSISKHLESEISRICKLHNVTEGNEIRDFLVKNGVCDANEVPPVEFITKLVKKVHNQSTLVRVNSNRELLTHRTKRTRTVFSMEQIESLENVFKLNRYPDLATREKLSAAISIPEAQIQVWFSNRRARYRKMSFVRCDDQNSIQADVHEQMNHLQPPTMSHYPQESQNTPNGIITEPARQFYTSNAIFGQDIQQMFYPMVSNMFYHVQNEEFQRPLPSSDQGYRQLYYHIM